MVIRFGRCVAAWLLLSAFTNLRFPGDETKLSYLFPSLDVTLLFALIAAFVARGARWPAWLTSTLVTLFCAFRLLRFGDGIQQNFFHRPFNVYLDVPLVPELVRLLWNTTPRLSFWFGCVGLLLLTVGFVFAVRWAIGVAVSSLREPALRSLYFGTALALVVISPFGPREHGDEQYNGMFAASIAPRFAHELDFLLHVAGYREAKLAEVRAAARRVHALSSSLQGLNSTPVFVFLVESYGVTVFDPKLASPETERALAEFEASLRRNGYTLASGLLESPVYGGSSWLAQATLATAVQTRDEFQLALVKAEQPPTIADVFRRAGYRTVLVQPGTTRPYPEHDFLRFDARYAAFDLDYRGPRFAWAPMPDQFVLEAIDRREIRGATRPLFIEYALVSSHAPWSDQPTLIEDWDSLGNGEIFAQSEKVRFDTRLVGGAVREAYLRSIRYDFEVLGQYLSRRLDRDALIFVLGDHQPIPRATAHSERRSVPIHVISRRRELVEAFLTRGYVPTLRPELAQTAAPLANFLPMLLETLGSKLARGPR